MPRTIELYQIAIIESQAQKFPEMIEVEGLYAAKQLAMWGTYGKGGAEHCSGTCPEHPLRWKRLIDCDTEHLQAILRTQWQLWYPGVAGTCDYPDIIKAILKDRGVEAETYKGRLIPGPFWNPPSEA